MPGKKKGNNTAARKNEVPVVDPHAGYERVLHVVNNKARLIWRKKA